MDPSIKTTIKHLKARNFIPHYAANSETAVQIVQEKVPQNAVVGFGDSSSVRQIGIADILKARGNHVINPFDRVEHIVDYKAYSRQIFRSSIEAALCDFFITGSNALTEDGRLINIDGVGNRVAGMIWGHPNVVLIVGKNKILKNLEWAMDRVKKVTAPEHVARRQSSKSPCTKTGECMDCWGSNRICNITTLIEGAPLFSNVNVIIIDEDLGLGWDRSWSKERIESISDRHSRHMWTMPEEAIRAHSKEELWGCVEDLLYRPKVHMDSN